MLPHLDSNQKPAEKLEGAPPRATGASQGMLNYLALPARTKLKHDIRRRRTTLENRDVTRINYDISAPMVGALAVADSVVFTTLKDAG